MILLEILMVSTYMIVNPYNAALHFTLLLNLHQWIFFEDIPFGALVAVVVSKDKQSDKAKRDTKNSVKSHSHYTFKDNDEFKDTVNQQLIGYGIYNPHSMYRVRMLLHETIHPGLTKEIRSLRKEMQRGAEFSENDALASILEKKVTDAIQLRMAMNLPSSDTDTYRLINGEGDGLSGLAVDVMGGNTAIVMSSAAWCEIHKDTILSILSKSLALHPSYEDENVDIVWRNTPSRLAQDGYELVEEVERGSEEDPSVVATESSIKYLTFPYSDGQKTGFYCDQRENRKMIAKYCENKRVLDLCCYSGGFSLNAVIHGKASSALGVDSSQDAVDSSTANAKLNGLDDSIISFVRDDIAAFMKSAIDRDEQYDVIILDPPKLAPSISTLTKASRKYHSLNRDAMNLIDKNRGGLLLTCTCSAAMTQSNGGQFFLGVVNNAALSAKRQATLLSVNGAAPCHTQSPASFPAGNYLTCALFFIGPA
jgi:23S rRNA G2069 N7-methylase RlmK/C1962 C5-methylase RlmI